MVTDDHHHDDSGAAAHARAEAIAAALEAEAGALDRLCHALEVQRILLEQARADLLPQAGRDVEDAMGAVRSSDLVRAVTVSTVAASTGRFPTLGRIAAALDPPSATVMVDLGRRLERALARAVALADENRARLGAARDLLADDELAMWAAQWAEEFGHAVDELHRLVDEPAQPQRQLADVERALFAEEDERLALALADLRLQAVAFEAALGLLQTVGCRPLLEFISDLD